MKRLSHILIFILIFIIGLLSKIEAQNIGINGTGANAHPSALLDVDAVATPSLGLLMPRIELQAINVSSPVNAPATSLLLYNTATASTGTNAVTPGYYYWDGVKWVRFSYTASGSSSTAWDLLGNAGTTAGIHFIGTSDNQNLVFKTNNVERMRMLSTGNIGIGTPAPTASLHVVATATNTGFQLQDGTEGGGKLLVSDATGHASWANTTGTTTVINSNVGNSVFIPVTGLPVFSGSKATVAIAGYYILTIRLLSDKTPDACGQYNAINIGTSSLTPTGFAIPIQDIHMVAGPSIYDCSYTSTIVYLNTGTYHLWLRNGLGCTSNKLRATFGENSFTLTLLK